MHWPIDGSMSDFNGACSGVAVFWVNEGFHLDADLSGIAFAIYNFFPPKMSSGDWHTGLVADAAATDEQALAVEQIISGRHGGPFAAVAGLVGEYLGREHAEIRFGGTERPSVWIDRRGSFRFEPSLDASGDPVTVNHAMYPFANGFVIGTTSGEHYAFGETWEPGYGEYARFEFSSETLAMEQGLGIGRGPR